MILTKMAERKLDSTPTSLYLRNGKIYVGLKKKYAIETEYDVLILKKIPVEENIRAIVGHEEGLLFFLDKGGLYGLSWGDDNAANRILFRKKIINTGLYDQSSGRVVIGTSKGKVLVLNQSLEISKTFYESPSGIINLSVSDLGKVACIYEVDSSVKVFDLKHPEVKSVSLSNGFPQAIAFVGSTHLVVGGDSGELCVVDTTVMSIVSSLKIPQAVTVLLWKDGYLLIGGENILYLSSVTEDHIEIIDSYECNGFVNAVTLEDGYAVVGIGKEPRLGRWKVKKNGEHKLIVLKVG
ncbi:uncharacterized protein Eint_070080 [Encephalitozoon intestinalis ATCC 50506]|uniref:WD40 domain-containing protein n=1 Tax=Encephalitozoon intestinalis (strain ATCC 50506) TaxID=876142 RepID=E0S7T8_ENCIT|nr:uncharacterized protein Eint_070080 [Encephalitozoon intestinalis ATCC 50506]ADM11773.1 hypothetical protein Eint_070080 [Encephalitozoon intestinalis ATCC 50506]UTX45521.1 hypothetical protein GPK93_07g10830 [Encephalitozoon intestinalis]